jgi:LuxR family maltose regulon positive regulatory protein
VKWAQGDAECALKLAYEAKRLARESGAPQAIADATFWKARLHLTRNDIQAAASELERASDGCDRPSSARESERISLAQLLIVQEEYDEALRVLEHVRQMAQAADRTSNVIEILALKALALRANEEKGQALNVMGRVLALAEPEGYVRIFVDEGPPMTELLSEVLEAQQSGRLDSPRRIPAHYLRKLLAALERDTASTAQPTTELPEALSERELEVLQLIAAGKSNRRALHQRGHRQDPRQQPLPQTRRPQPHPSGGKGEGTELAVVALAGVPKGSCKGSWRLPYRAGALPGRSRTAVAVSLERSI